MSELGEVKRRIAEFETKGEVNKAITELEQAIKEFPKEGSLFNKLGDLYIKVNRKKEALDVYEQGAKVFQEETYFPNAIALCKKILRLDKERIVVYELLGNFHKELDQRGEAAHYFLEYAERKMKENDLEAALKTYTTIKELVPNNPKILETISAIYEKVGKKKEGAELRREAQAIETKQEKLKETFAAQESQKEVVSEKPVKEEPLVIETFERQAFPPTPEEPAAEEKIEEEAPPEEKPPEEPAQEPETTVEEVAGEVVSPEVSEADEHVEEEIAHEEPARELSEVEKTIELGELYLSLGSEDEAIDCYRGAVEEVWKQKDYNRALTLNQKIAALRPFDLKSRHYIVEIAEATGDRELQIQAMLDLAESLNRREAKGEALAMYKKVLVLEPANTKALDMIAAFEQPKEFIDLGEVLKADVADEKIMEVQSIDGLISQFRREVFESIGEGDYHSRYDLGVAYKGMGLYQEATEEFEIAAKDPELKLKALEMIGSCFLERGKIDDAMRVLNEGLKVTERPTREYFGIHFLLGKCFEKKKKMREALRQYLNAYQIDKTVPELTSKMTELKKKLETELAGKGKKDVPGKERVKRAAPRPVPTDQARTKKSKITYL